MRTFLATSRPSYTTRSLVGTAAPSVRNSRLSPFRTVTRLHYLNLNLKHICSPPSMLLNCPVRQRFWSHGDMALYTNFVLYLYCYLSRVIVTTETSAEGTAWSGLLITCVKLFQLAACHCYCTAKQKQRYRPIFSDSVLRPSYGLFLFRQNIRLRLCVIAAKPVARLVLNCYHCDQGRI